MKLWHIEFMVGDKHLHDVMSYLEGRAYSPKFTVVKNGAEEKPKSKRKAPANGVRAMSEAQQLWIAKNLNKDMTHAELRKAWDRTNFRRTGLYGALKKAIKDKLIKKTADGIYKPTEVK